MELILLAALELVIPMAMFAMSLTVNVLALLVDLAVLIGSFWNRTGNSPVTKADADSERAAARSRKRKRRTLQVLAGASGLLVILVAAAAVANIFYFESLTRWMFSHLEKRAGVTLDFEKVSGSFWTGDFRFTNLTARRADHPGSVFNFRVASAEVDISIRDLLWRNIVFDHLKVSGVDGAFEKRGRSPNRLKPRRAFTLNDFELTGANLAYANATLARPFKGQLKLDHLRSTSLASDSFIGGLFFRSNAAGSFNGVAFSIVNRKIPRGGFQTTWVCGDMPVGALASLLGGPFAWFESGRVDLRVDNRSRPGGKVDVVMDWNLVFRDFKAQIPAQASPAAKMGMTPLVTYINGRGERWDLGFRVDIKPDDLKFASTDDLSALIVELVGQQCMAELSAMRDLIKSQLWWRPRIGAGE